MEGNLIDCTDGVQDPWAPAYCGKNDEEGVMKYTYDDLPRR